MYLTNEQRRLIEDTSDINVTFLNLFEEEHQLGYCYKDNTGYNVRVDEGELNEDEQKVVLLHELGHIELRHLKINIPKAEAEVRQCITDLNLPEDIIENKIGSFMNFMNVCLDLEVNSKFLTFEDFDIMRANDHAVLSIDDEDKRFDYQDSYEGYYKPVLNWLKTLQDMPKIEIILDFERGVNESGGLESDDEGPEGSSPLKGGKGKPSGQSESLQDKIKRLIDDRGKPSNKKKPTNKKAGDVFKVDKEKSEIDDENNGDPNKPGNYGNSQNNGTSYGYGTEGYTATLTGSNSKKIKDFLTSLMSRQFVRQPDSMRLHNRGIRRNPQGLLYTSTRTKREKDKMKLGILIDVSGSMNIEDISIAINSLGGIVGVLHADSKVVTWGNSFVQEWKIFERFPDRLETGFGTDMLAGMQYLLNDGYTDVVVYSDWETPYMSEIIDLAQHNNIYGILVNSGRDAECLKPLFKKYLEVKNRRY